MVKAVASIASGDEKRAWQEAHDAFIGNTNEEEKELESSDAMRHEINAEIRKHEMIQNKHDKKQMLLTQQTMLCDKGLYNKEQPIMKQSANTMKSNQQELSQQEKRLINMLF